MVQKVMGSQELLRSSGTVTKKLAAWLYEQGYVSESERDLAMDQGARAARDLPPAEHLANLLYKQCAEVPDCDPDALDEEDTVEDQLTIERIETGALYFSGEIGPLAVSERASELAKVGWDNYASLVRIADIWWLDKVGNVYSM
ncbi:MAG: hypothetical protein M1447_08570 [Gammaproteobacteria bacterium]|jgi:hypothetical protein|nr:hypothetical protein [Gammaproteobacteria bacterium]